MAIEPPFIGNLLSYLVILMLLFILYYSFEWRKIENRIANQPELNQPIRQETQKKGKENQTIYSIHDPPTFYMSIVILNTKIDIDMLKYIEKIDFIMTNKLENDPSKTFEIIVAFLPQENSDYLQETLIQLSKQKNYIRFFKILPNYGYNAIFYRGVARSRGKYVFVINADDNLDMDDIEKYFEAQESISSSSNDYSMIIGRFSKSNDEYEYPSNLCEFLEAVRCYILNFYNIQDEYFIHSNSVMYSRETARMILANMQVDGLAYIEESLLLCKKSAIYTSLVQLKAKDNHWPITSLQRIEGIFDIFRTILFYYTGLYPIKFPTRR